MSSFELQSNEELYRYLLALATQFERKGKLDIAAEIKRVTMFVVGSPTEFLDETERLLVSLQGKCRGVLSDEQFTQLTVVIRQIEDAFRRVGGA